MTNKIKLKHNIIYSNIKTLNVTTTIENEKTVDILIFLISFLDKIIFERKMLQSIQRRR